MTVTIRQVVDDALSVVGEVAGAGVQAFSEDILFDNCIRGFNLLFKKYPWDQYTDWFQLTLDGVTGKVTTTPFTNVIDPEDILSVRIDKSISPLPVLGQRQNPFNITGTTPRFWKALPATDADYETKRIIVYPKTATGLINVQARIYPRTLGQDWDWEDKMYLDKIMLVAATAYQSLISDETNSGAAEAQRLLMEARFTDIKAILADHPISSSSQPDIPDQWFERY
jgi:hypothetical protein